MSETHRGFSILSESWYGEQYLQSNEMILEDITFGDYYDDGSTTGEMSMKWTLLCDSSTACLRCYDDSFKTLYGFADVLLGLAAVSGRDIKPAEFVEILKKCGFRDGTEREKK